MKRLLPCLLTLMFVTGCNSNVTTAPAATGIVVCEKLEIFPSGHISCHRIHNGYRFATLPARATFCTFAQVPGTKEGLRFQYRVKDSDGTEIDATPAKWLDGLANPVFSHKIVAEFADVEFKHSGQYDIELEVNSQLVGKTSLTIEQGGAPNQNSTPQNPNAGK